MFLPFDRQPMFRSSRFAPLPDATGTPFAPRSKPDHTRTAHAEPQDFREQADGAP